MSDLLNRDSEDINYNLPEENPDELPEELEIEKEIDEDDELLDETELDAHPQG